MSHDNPLLLPWTTPHGLPPFDRIKAEHFPPALKIAMEEHLDELARLADNPAEPDFANTVAAFDRSGELVYRLLATFDNLVASLGSPELLAAEEEMAPRIAAWNSEIYLNAKLFARIEAVWKHRKTQKIKGEDLRLLERIRKDFVMAGALLSGDARERCRQINERLAELHTAFNQTVLASEADYALALSNERDMAGLPGWLMDSAREAARARGRDGEALITLNHSTVDSFLTWSTRRDLRERIWKAWASRGEGEGRDTRPQIAEIMALRQELAGLHGHSDFATYTLTDRMAATPPAVLDLLQQVWQPALERVAAEAAILRRRVKDFGDDIDLEPWDWMYYAEKERAASYQLDDAEIKPFFSLERMIEAMFYCAGRIFDIEFVELCDTKLYHPDVRIWEVRHRSSGHLAGIFVGDNFAREGKRGGAWMSEYRTQTRNVAQGEVYPIIVNNNNFAKPLPGQEALLSFDDVKTLFHEFGHALHGLLSNVTWRTLAGTSVLQDFVELPSQIMEHWALEPEVLRRFALHVQSGQAISDELISRIRKAHTFNQGYLTVRYTASALLDMHLHLLPDCRNLDPAALERELTAKLGIPELAPPRHRLAHFRHLFSSLDYAAGYYAYLWAEVLEADAFAAFEEKGDPFDPELCTRLKSCIFTVGNSRDPAQAFRDFRGRDPRPQAMLRSRGLCK